MIVFLLMACLSSPPPPTDDLSGYAAVDRRAAPIGDTIELTVSAHYPLDWSARFALPHSETLRLSLIDEPLKRRTKTGFSETAVYRIRGEEGGHLLLPGDIVLQSLNRQEKVIKNEAIFLDFGPPSFVSEVDQSIEYPPRSNWWLWALVVALLCGILFYGRKIRLWRRVDTRSPTRMPRFEWDLLVASNGHPYDVAVGLSDYFRKYIGVRFAVDLSHFSPLELDEFILDHPEMDSIQKEQARHIFSEVNKRKYAGESQTGREWIQKIDLIFDRFFMAMERDAEDLR